MIVVVVRAPTLPEFFECTYNAFLTPLLLESGEEYRVLALNNCFGGILSWLDQLIIHIQLHLKLGFLQVKKEWVCVEELIKIAILKNQLFGWVEILQSIEVVIVNTTVVGSIFLFMQKFYSMFIRAMLHFEFVVF